MSTPRDPRNDEQATEATGDYHLPEANGQASFSPTERLPSEETVAPEFGVSSASAAPVAATGVYIPQATKEGRNHDPAAHTEPAGPTGAYTPSGTPIAEESPRDAAADSGKRKTHGKAGSRVGRYVLQKFHAKGGMGEIWLADDPAIGRAVALKRMFGTRPDKQERFLVEARVTGKLEHPGIVPVHEVGRTEEGHPFYVMKFIHGRTLKNVIQELHEPVEPSAVPREVQLVKLLQSFLCLCQTVAYAHSHSVLHRDLKPDNVMLGPFGETVLLDWGLAKVMGQPDHPAEPGVVESVKLTGESTETRAGAIMGSPSYMSPEVAAGLNTEIDQRSDIYLLGATLYEIITGRLPREDSSVLRVLELARNHVPEAPRKVKRDLPRPLEAICLKAMAPRKEDRYQTAQALAEDMERYLAGEPVSAYRERVHERIWRFAKRHRRLLGSTAAAVAILGLGLFGLAKINEARKLQREAQVQADELMAQEQARNDVKQFRRLADEARFYAATADPVSEHAPFFDPAQGEATGQAALAIAERWGAALADLPLVDERPQLKLDLYDLMLLLAQIKAGKITKPGEASALLDFLAGAAALQESSGSYHRLRSQAYRLLGEDARAAEEMTLAEKNQAGATALDHFLLGESYRTAASRQASAADVQIWRPNPELLAKAALEYRRALQLDPNHYWSHFQLGRCYQSLGRGAEAVGELGTCVVLKPDSPWGYTARAMALIYLKRHEEAESDLNRVLTLAPDNRLARLHRGVVYWIEGKRDLALEDFTRVLDLPEEKRLPEAAFYRGQFYLQDGDAGRALQDFDLVVALRPSFWTVYQYRCQIYFARGEDARGMADVDRYLARGREFDPHAPEAYEQRGHLLRFLKMPNDLARKKAQMGARELARAVALGRRSASVYNDLGAALEESGQVEDAIKAYSQGLRIAPDNVLLLVKRGWALDQLNKLQEAEADFAHAVRVAPRYAEAHTGLAYQLARRQQRPEAQREADLALLHGGANYLVLHNTACVYAALAQSDQARKTGHQDAAIAMLQRSLELWREEGGELNEMDLIKGEPAFGEELRRRPEFLKLLESR
jgi:tetratricopeptide (TPR) repeat protein/tRNA A-37 threonylcarbamoyl transferase component Bud32